MWDHWNIPFYLRKLYHMINERELQMWAMIKNSLQTSAQPKRQWFVAWRGHPRYSSCSHFVKQVVIINVLRSFLHCDCSTQILLQWLSTHWEVMSNHFIHEISKHSDFCQRKTMVIKRYTLGFRYLKAPKKHPSVDECLTEIFEPY